jgi:hypothetical protein
MKSAHQRHQCRIDAVSEAIRRAGSIGDLERLAGIPPTPEDRTAFWLPFSHLPGASALDAGVAELKRRIIAAAAAAGPQQKTHRRKWENPTGSS